MSKLHFANEKYMEEVKSYTWLDSVISILFLLVYMGMIILETIILRKLSLNNTVYGIICIVFNFFCAALVLVPVRARGQRIESIGLTKGRIDLSLILGAVLSIFIAYFNCIQPVMTGQAAFIDVSRIIYLAFFYLSVAVCEEVIFRGYLLTRLYGWCKSIFVAVIISGLLFALSHYPYLLLVNQTSFVDFLSNTKWIINLFTTHCIFSLIYLKTKSLWGAVLPHWVSDFACNIISFF